MTKKYARKHYEKPCITEVKLEVEEAVLSSCKVGFGLPGHSSRNCDTAPCKKGPPYGS